MSQIVVKSSAALEDIIVDLTNERANLIDYQVDIEQEQAKLAQMWTGDASTAFQDNYQKEKGNFDKAIEALEQYIQAMRDIKERYERAEAANVNIANS